MPAVPWARATDANGTRIITDTLTTLVQRHIARRAVI
jgi:hypothetical protein